MSVTVTPVGWQHADPWALPGVFVVCVVAVLSAGPIGAVAAVATAVGWAMLAPPYVATIGGLSLLAVGVAGPAVAVGVGGVALVLVGPVAIRTQPVPAVFGTAAVAVGLGVATWVVLDAGGSLAGAGALVVIVGSVGYTLHRYALVRVAGAGRLGEGGGRSE